jgi:sphingomyelin phosphodiesterase acid-like 3
MANMQKESHESSLYFFFQVYIIAHVPVGYLPFSSGIPAMRQYYNEKLIDIFRRYSSVIAGQFYGHTHRDSIMVLSDEKGIVTFCMHLPSPR